MSIPDFELDPVFRIHSRDGYFYEVRFDADGLKNIEIAYFEDAKDTEPKHVISMLPDAAVLVVSAFDKLLRM